MPRKPQKEADLNVSTGGAATRHQKVVRSRAKRATTEAETPAPALAAATAYEPSPEEVAKLAFLFWEARGCQGGSSEEDWLRAERELRGGVSAATA